MEINKLTKRFYILAGSPITEYSNDKQSKEFLDIIEDYIKSWDDESLVNLHVEEHSGYPCFVTNMLHKDRDKLGYNIGKYGGLKEDLHSAVIGAFNKIAPTLEGIDNKDQLLSWEMVSKGLSRGRYLREKAKKEGRSIDSILCDKNKL